MQQRGKRAPKTKPGLPARLVWTRTERLWLLVVLMSAVALFVGTVTLELHFTHEGRLGRTLSAWRIEYHLSPEQERKIRVEEERFHGGAIVLTGPLRSAEEAVEHETALSQLMNPEDGGRFLSYQMRPTDQPAPSILPTERHQE